MWRHLGVVVVAGLLGPACVAVDPHLEETLRRHRCSTAGAYEAGVDAGSAGEALDRAYGGDCGASEVAAAASAYRDGHREGLGRRLAEGEARGWTCEVEAFGETFSGASRIEARAAAEARERCRAKRDEMFCRPVTCRPGR